MDSESLLERLWRAALLLLATALALFAAWQLLQPLLPFVGVALLLLGIIRLAMGGAVSRRRW